MAQTKMKTVMQGAFILTMASFAAKLLSAVYRVPFQNLVGDEGFYVYQQVYPIYGLAMTLALSGLPQFISKYVAEQEGIKAQHKAIHRLFPMVLLSGILLFVLTFLGAGVIANLMGDPELAPLIRVVSVTFLFVPILSFYRGNFQGNLLMTPTAVSQVWEQLVRVAVILLASFSFVHWGLSIYQTGTVAMFGAVCGGIVAVLILLSYQRKITGSLLGLNQIDWRDSWDYSLFRRFLLEGGLVSVYSGLLILFQLVDSFFVVNALDASGLLPQVARVTKGVYDRGQPLVQLGLVVAGALSSTFLPALTKYLMQKNKEGFQQTAKIYMRLTTSISLAASAGLALLLPLINFALFKDAAGTIPLMLYVGAIFEMGIIQGYQSIAQSQNHFRIPLRGALLGLLTKLVVTWPFTYFLQTSGASCATLLGLGVTLVYLALHTDREINHFLKEKFLAKLFLCTLAMMVAVFIFDLLLLMWDPALGRLNALLFAIIGVALGVGAFLKIALWCKLFTVREWLMLPLGDKILKLGRKKE
ncbi:polysaccharide biosynthesis protein [Enterococcus asini]|uniref:putative polysaccharide biosynthesis protein n=1 Tax=Enterococcus asini TaxID=57732 RepID=UPI00288F0DF3|nr:polysaccharide biosynthesis protein [Enterococcus asini]MDT2757573.1 polysaccharide biosynthesis protein [Enterococcus asini]